MGGGEVELGDDHGNDGRGFVREVFGSGMGDKRFPVTEVAVLGSGSGALRKLLQRSTGEDDGIRVTTTILHDDLTLGPQAISVGSAPE